MTDFEKRIGYTFIGWIVGTYNNSFNQDQSLILKTIEGSSDQYLINYCSM